MARQFQNPQPSLFEEEGQRIELTPAHRAQLATLVEALLLEIAAVLATGEAGDDQDNG
jgi:hypothetical protein